MEIEFYVLELEGARYYVGQSKEAERRIAAHFKGKGAAWTKRYKPVKVMRRWGSGLTDWKEAERGEPDNSQINVGARLEKSPRWLLGKHRRLADSKELTQPQATH